MTESEYRNAVFHVDAACDALQRATRGSASKDEREALISKLEAAKQSLATLLESATEEDRRTVTIAMIEDAQR